MLGTFVSAYLLSLLRNCFDFVWTLVLENNFERMFPCDFVELRGLFSLILVIKEGAKKINNAL